MQILNKHPGGMGSSETREVWLVAHFYMSEDMVHVPVSSIVQHTAEAQVEESGSVGELR